MRLCRPRLTCLLCLALGGCTQPPQRVLDERPQVPEDLPLRDTIMIVDRSNSEQDMRRLEEFANHALADARPLQRLTVADELLTAIWLIHTDGCTESVEPGYCERMRGSQVLIFRGAATVWLKHSPNAVVIRNLHGSNRADQFSVDGKEYVLSSFRVGDGASGERITFWVNGNTSTPLKESAGVLRWLLNETKFKEGRLYLRDDYFWATTQGPPLDVFRSLDGGGLIGGRPRQLPYIVCSESRNESASCHVDPGQCQSRFPGVPGDRAPRRK